VKDEHYELVGRAFLDTLAKAFGDEFTPETREAWTEAYTLMATVMKMGAREMSDGANAAVLRKAAA